MRSKRKLADLPPIEAQIEALSHEGRGITSIEGKKAFILGALIGEKVRFKITASKKGYDEGEVLEVLEASPLRVEPPCVYFGQCGGCNLQHLNIEAALKHKEQVVLDNLLHMGQVIPEQILPAISSSAKDYRRKARLGVRYVIKKESLLIGFRERTSNRIAIMDSCHILDKRVSHLISPLKAFIRGLDGFDSIAQIEVATSDECVALVIRHLKPLSETDQIAWIHFAEQHHSINLAIYLQPKGPESVHKLYPIDANIFLKYKQDDIVFQFHPLDFVQVNAEVNQKMLAQALKLLECEANDQILDLFCGLGNFTLPIAKKVQNVIGVEGSDTAIQRAKMNAEHNAIHNVKFYVKDLTKPFDEKDEWVHQAYTKIILDPPRTGAKEIVECIERWSAKKIVYVSCNPTTLARDAHILVHEKGYKLKSMGVMDMFPHTAHIETMMLFEK
jgi:23S rRNA (uracil1939-C5)-methyltransferase